MTTAAPASPATPIFDEVDRWWRDGSWHDGDRQVPATMLSFTGARSHPVGSATAATATATATSGPRHGLLRPPAPPA